MATIRLQRPELLGNIAMGESAPISDRPPDEEELRTSKNIEDIGPPVNPSFFVNSQTDPTNW